MVDKIVNLNAAVPMGGKDANGNFRVDPYATYVAIHTIVDNEELAALPPSFSSRVRLQTNRFAGLPLGRLPTAQSKIEARYRCLQPATSPRETFGFQCEGGKPDGLPVGF